MSLFIQGEPVEISLADSAPGAKSAGKWSEIARTGAFKGHVSGPFEITPQTLNDIVRNFKATENKSIICDFEHFAESTDPSIAVTGAPAQGWITDLRIEGDRLLGLIEWLEPARTYIREGKYKFVSPAIRFGSRDRVTGQPIGARLSSLALVGQPFLDGLRPVAAKDQVNAVETANEDILEYEKLYKESQEKIAALTAEKVALSAKVDELTKENATFTLSLKDTSASKDAAEGELKTLRAWKEEREAKDLSDRVALAFDTYKDTKKLGEADKNAMTIVLKADPETFEKLYPKVAPSQQHLLRNVTETREAPAATVIDSPNQYQSESIIELTDRLARERKISFEAAQNLALKLRSGR